MNDDFCNYENSKLLKDLGFNQPTFREYFTDKTVCLVSGIEAYKNAVLNNTVIACKAPLLSQAISFIDDCFDIQITIAYNDIFDEWNCIVDNIMDSGISWQDTAQKGISIALSKHNKPDENIKT